MSLFISLALPFVTGYTFLNFLFRKNRLNLAVSLSLSYGLGLGILTQWMFLLGILGIKYNVQIIGAPLLIFSIFLVPFVFKRGKKNYVSTVTMSSIKTLDKVFCVLLGAYIVYYIFYVFWRALNIPIYSWDAIASIAFKAKVFFFEKTIPNLKNFPSVSHPSYPIHVPLIQTWIALNLGVWNEQLIKIIFPIAFLSFIIIHNNFLTYYTNKKWALFGTVLLISSNLLILHATISYRDLFLLYYNCTTIILLLLWNSKKDDAFLILAALYAGFATFTKLEGTAYLVIYTALFFLILLYQKISPFRKNLNKFLKFTIPGFSICFFYHFYKILTKVPTEKLRFNFTWASLSRIPIILEKFAEDIFLSGNWNIIWFLLVLSLVVNFTKFRKKIEVKLLFLTLAMFFGLYFLNCLLTENFIWILGISKVPGLSRLILHFFPLATMLIILLNYPNESNNV